MSRRTILAWTVLFLTAVGVGDSLVADIADVSAADRFVLARWSIPGLRMYLWLEAGFLAAFVIALGAHTISTGLTVARGGIARFVGTPVPANSRIPSQVGYVFVLLGSGLVALSLTMLALLNSCRYMRIV